MMASDLDAFVVYRRVLRRALQMKALDDFIAATANDDNDNNDDNDDDDEEERYMKLY